MSDDKDNEKPEQYVSQVDSLFAQAYNKVHDPAYGKGAGEGGEEGDSAGSSAPKGTAPGEGVSAETAAAIAARARGEGLPTAGDPGLGGDADAGEGAPDPNAADAGGDAAAESADAGADRRSEGIGDLESKDAVALFAPARKAANDNFEDSFRRAAIADIQADIDPGFIELAQTPAVRLVGREVPNLHGEGNTKLLTSDDAARYQRDLVGLVEAEVRDKIKVMRQDSQPMRTVIAESFLMFENNPDLIPGTKDFDPELAALVVEQLKSYELKTPKGVIGYQDVNVQPLINSIRATLAKGRGASGATAAARQAAARAAAAAQPREEDGKFSAPQGGVLSKANMSGGDDSEDFSAFWSASGVQPRSLGI